MLTKLKIIDNSGAKFARIIKILNKKPIPNLGGFVLLSILKNIPHSKIRKGDLVKAILVNGNNINLTRKTLTTKSLILIKISAKGKEYIPLGTRIKGPISSNLRNINGMNRIISLSKYTL